MPEGELRRKQSEQSIENRQEELQKEVESLMVKDFKGELTNEERQRMKRLSAEFNRIANRETEKKVSDKEMEFLKNVVEESKAVKKDSLEIDK